MITILFLILFKNIILHKEQYILFKKDKIAFN